MGKDAAESMRPGEAAIREAAAELRAHRKRPCLLYISRQVAYSDLFEIWEALGTQAPEALDVIVSSPGGDIEAAYLVARELRRRAQQLTIYVPFRTKSASALIALAADELVLGTLGELGPLDAQYDEKQAADFPINTSRLLLDTALRELEDHAVSCYDQAITRILKQSGMRPFEACSKAAEFVGTLYSPILAKLDPARLAESARGLNLGRAYASRLLRRYRPGVSDDDWQRLLDRLVRDYPAHSFIIDREEAEEIGLPVRSPDPKEEDLLDVLAVRLMEFGTDQDLIAMAGPGGTAVPAGESALNARENRPKKTGGKPRVVRRRPTRSPHAPRKQP